MPLPPNEKTADEMERSVNPIDEVQSRAACNGGLMQSIDSRDEFCGQGNCRFECGPARGVCVRRRPAIEAKPRMDIDQHALPVDEVRDPRRAFPNVDRDLAVRAESQQLALDQPGGYSLHWQPVGSMPPSPPPEHVAAEVPSLNAVVARATVIVASRPDALPSKRTRLASNTSFRCAAALDAGAAVAA